MRQQCCGCVHRFFIAKTVVTRATSQLVEYEDYSFSGKLKLESHFQIIF